MPTETDYDFIDTLAGLQDCCGKLAEKSWVALDTEFIREKTYRPELCLLQIKSGDILAAVDTLAVKDLSPLSVILHNPAVTKVFHAASQDLEIFYWLDRKVPSPLFDTQVAAPVLGYNEQIGYGNLVREMLGVELPKAHTRADWSRRPLPANQLRYALDDVIYLEQLYLAQKKTLQKLNRIEWLQPEFEALTEPTKYDKPARDMWKKMRAAQKLKGPSLAVLQSLAEWREIKARERNLPRSWLIKDDVLVDMALQLPENPDELSHIRGLSSRFRNQYAGSLIELIRESKQLTPEALPPHDRKIKATPEQNAVIDVLSAYVNFRAAELNINPALLASRKMLESCVKTGDTASLSGWRHPLLGAQVQALLDGDSLLGVSNGRLTITARSEQ